MEGGGYCHLKSTFEICSRIRWNVVDTVEGENCCTKSFREGFVEFTAKLRETRNLKCACSTWLELIVDCTAAEPHQKLANVNYFRIQIVNLNCVEQGEKENLIRFFFMLALSSSFSGELGRKKENVLCKAYILNISNKPPMKSQSVNCDTIFLMSKAEKYDGSNVVTWFEDNPNLHFSSFIFYFPFCKYFSTFFKHFDADVDARQTKTQSLPPTANICVGNFNFASTFSPSTPSEMMNCELHIDDVCVSVCVCLLNLA